MDVFLTIILSFVGVSVTFSLLFVAFLVRRAPLRHRWRDSVAMEASPAAIAAEDAAIARASASLR